MMLPAKLVAVGDDLRIPGALHQGRISSHIMHQWFIVRAVRRVSVDPNLLFFSADLGAEKIHNSGIPQQCWRSPWVRSDDYVEIANIEPSELTMRMLAE